MNFKKAIWGIPALVFLLLPACEQEQTALNIDSIAGQAVIKGRILYQSGEVQDGNYVNEVWNPAEGQTVYAYLSNADLTGNASAVGETSYSAVIDANGDYTLTLPATTAGVAVRLELTTFEGTYSQADGINATAGTIQYKTLSGYYEAPTNTLNIKNAMTYIEDFNTYAFTARTVINDVTLETTDYVKVSGTLTYTAESRSTDLLTVTSVNKPAVGKKILVTKGTTVYSAVSKSVTVGEETVAVYDVYLPVDGASENATIYIEPVSYEGTYTQYILAGGKYSTSNSLTGKYSWDGLFGTQYVTLEKGFTTYITKSLNYTFTAYPDFAQ
jgi:hypothetical protein